MPDYTVYIEQLEDLRQREEALIRKISQLKKKHRRKFQTELEETEDALTKVRADAARICAMLDKLREKKGEKVMQKAEHLWDEKEQMYNEVIGVCYGKAILWADDCTLYWFDCPDEGTVTIGDTESDDGLLYPLSALPAGERKMILSYLIEAGSTPIHYLDLLKEELK